jgi:3-phenylpropionate/trans-cinnamate dioxygenase ferredoxin subunit
MQSADQFYKVIELSALKPGEGKLVYAGIKKLALFLLDGELHCIQNHCPHAGASLALGAVKGCIVKCPRHDWGFDFTDGSCKTNPRYDVKRYATRVEDGWVYVGLPADGGF